MPVNVDHDTDRLALARGIGIAFRIAVVIWVAVLICAWRVLR